MDEGEAGGAVVDLDEANAAIDAAVAEAEVEMVDGGAAAALQQLQLLVDLQEKADAVDTEVISSRSSHDGDGRIGDMDVKEVTQLEEMKELVEKSRQKRSLPVTRVNIEEVINVDEIVEEEVKKMRPAAPISLKMPWETGFAALVLGGGQGSYLGHAMSLRALKPHGVVPELPREEQIEEAEKQVQEASDGVLAKILGGTTRRPMKVEDKERRDKVFRNWLVVARAMDTSSPVVAMLDQDGEAILEDIFAKKKTGTLEVRASAMLLFIRWCQSKGFDPFPVTEQLAYVYVDELRKNNAPATRASSFRSALAFCKGTFLLEGIDTVLSSSRVTGSAHRSFLTKRLLKQRDALSVDQVQILEHVVCGDHPIREKVFAGHCLLCIYGRLRFGDSQNILEEPEIDGDYVECGLTIHKTMHLAGRARRLLPVVAPTIGVSGEDWGKSFLEARASATLKAWPGTPFMPAPVLGGGWTAGRLQTTEAAIWLCELLNKYGVPRERLVNIGAHSLKATALSWLAKAAVGEKCRRILGYHIKPKDTSVVLYSRDALSGSLEELVHLIGQIRDGVFRPDMSRSGTWNKEVAEPSTQEEMELSDNDEMLDVGSTGGCGTSVTEEGRSRSVERLALIVDQTSESEESEPPDAESEDERNVEAIVSHFVGPAKGASQELYRHRLSGTVHKGSNQEGKLACGRQVTSMFTKLDEPLHAVSSMCKVCAGYSR